MDRFPENEVISLTAVVAPVVGLAVALPYHYTGTFHLDWVAGSQPSARSRVKEESRTRVN